MGIDETTEVFWSVFAFFDEFSFNYRLIDSHPQFFFFFCSVLM